MERKMKSSLVLAAVVCASYIYLPGVGLQASADDYVWDSGTDWTSPATWGREDVGDYPHQVGDSATVGSVTSGNIWFNLQGAATPVSILNVGFLNSMISFSGGASGRFVMEAPGEGFAEINTINMTGSDSVNLPRMVLNSTTIVTASQGRLNFKGRSSTHTAITGTADIYFRGSGGISSIGDYGIVASPNSYSGNIIVDQGGTLLIEAVVEDHTGTSVTVADTGTLGGTSTLGRATTIQGGGTLAPGSSAGVMTFGSGLTLAEGSNFEFELFGNTVSERGVNYDGVNVTGGVLSVDSGAFFNIVLNGSGSTVDFTDDFWGSDQSWLVFGNGSEPLLSEGVFTLGAISQDAHGQDFAVTGGSFDFGVDGNDVYLLYTIPEPATMATLAGMVTVLVAFMRRRRRD